MLGDFAHRRREWTGQRRHYPPCVRQIRTANPLTDGANRNAFHFLDYDRSSPIVRLLLPTLPATVLDTKGATRPMSLTLDV